MGAGTGSSGSALALVGLVGGLFALVWFQPQKLFLDHRVNEALPSTATPGEAANGGGPRVLAQGDFRSLAHHTTGRVLALELADGSRILRLEGLDTSNGPDLRVRLSAAPSDEPRSALDRDVIDLGPLKGNLGSQNYRLPPGTDLSRFRSALVWCRRFGVGFSVAPFPGA